MAINYTPSHKTIVVSIDGKQLIKEEVIFSDKEEAYQNVNPLFKKVTEFQDKGWEVMSFNNISAGQMSLDKYTAYLRKKKA